MQCRNHPEENGVNTCNQCGSWICDRCSFERGGRIFCPACASQQASEKREAPPDRSRISHVGRSISWGLLFFFSIVIPLPGLNYMYLGLVKRGLVAMGTFFGLIYMIIQLSISNTWPLGIMFIFAIPILWLACTFDSFRLRERMNRGEVVTDNIDDIIAFIRRNRVLLTGLMLLLVAVHVLGGILPGVLRLLRHVIPIVIAVWAIQALFKKPKS